MLVFLFTDIEGSTKLWERHTAEMGAIIARHDALLRERVSASGGRITKHTGDGITAAFEGGEPVACALETQVRFAAESWGAIGELRIRGCLLAEPAFCLDHGNRPQALPFGQGVYVAQILGIRCGPALPYLNAPVALVHSPVMIARHPSHFLGVIAEQLQAIKQPRLILLDR